jgi:hypothetical protein
MIGCEWFYYVIKEDEEWMMRDIYTKDGGGGESIEKSYL